MEFKKAAHRWSDGEAMQMPALRPTNPSLSHSSRLDRPDPGPRADAEGKAQHQVAPVGNIPRRHTLRTS